MQSLNLPVALGRLSSLASTLVPRTYLGRRTQVPPNYACLMLVLLAAISITNGTRDFHEGVLAHYGCGILLSVVSIQTLHVHHRHSELS